MTTPTDYSVLADELTGLGEKATTRGPWKVTNGGLGIEGEPDATSDFDPVVIGGLKGGKGQISFPSYGIYSTPGRKEGEANAALIVSLVNALPTLTAALREAARLREVEAERDRMLKPEWFYSAEDPEYSGGDVEDVVQDMDHEGVMQVAGAREVWKKWVAIRCVALSASVGDVDETEVVTFDNAADAEKCWPESLAACRARALKEPGNG